jgi:hypothetical protein
MEGIVHYEYVPQGQAVNQQFYLQVLKRLETFCFSQEATETGGGGLGATSRQRTSAQSTFHQGIFGKSWHSCRSATTLLP